ncbi:NAD-dependent DNA ligase LigA [Oribacterium sp. oral taxon 108]|uniref:NAD-dependent DNA ligase LigA n=1 Tax=Oribacterium sp. oral taxon 108 TaxID=712414 RepID=UPI00020DD891|nr:NAD-dependent DNA ligase LigA [Oribacterium sp. oral taxon 108]EGL36707.1 DNA ligase (NAD+) [Oribacterium sp. oral taxon 108 str. F0425]
MDKRKRIEELVELLNQAGKAYYQEGKEIISNLEYDKAYDELVRLEEETGIVLSASPTQNVGYSVATALPKEEHASPMLSLDKTKSVETLQSFLGEQKGILSWKLDGLTVVMTYEKGELVKAVTRGNGRIGEIVTENAKRFRNLPLRIPFKGRLVLRGEALIRYSDFAKINEEIPEEGAKYKNPRNLCSGSVRQLDPKITWERRVYFFPFTLVSVEEGEDRSSRESGGLPDFHNSHEAEFEFLEQQGFQVVGRRTVNKEELPGAVSDFSEQVKKNDFPSDGLVLLMDDISYGKSLGTTAKFPRNALAFKWEDEEEKTILREVEWSPSRTGLINPVAIFDPVELEGTVVSRASLHNISYLEDLKLGIGDEITVYKANMIIPQIGENLTKSGQLPIPEHCPACHEETKIVQDKEAKMLYCENPHCPAKRIKQFALFVSRDALNIEGLSEMTLEKFIGKGFIQELPDLFSLEEHKEEIIAMEGFGQKSYDKLIENAEKARETSLARLLYGLGIGGIGASNARVLSEAFHEDAEELSRAELSEVVSIKGIGPILGESIVRYFKEEENLRLFRKLLSILHLHKEEKAENAALSGKVFVITGSLNHFQNRKELEEEIRKAGASTASSVSKNTSYLINNDKNSTSSKNKKAQELGIPILSEEDFLKLLQGE